jgi:hypothetical protein
MDVLVLKLLLTPALIGSVTLAGRRWGAGASGWLAGLPLTSGPIALYLAIEQGTAFARGAAVGTLLGLVSLAGFCSVYSAVASRAGWWLAVGGAILAFLVSTAILSLIALPVVAAFLVVVAILALSLRVVPGNHEVDLRIAQPWWDIPLRMALATAFVLILTWLGQALGPRLTGLIAPFPIFVTILVVFAHRSYGALSADRLLNGVIHGSFAFAAFFLVVALLIEPEGIAVTFVAAISVALAVQGRRVLRLPRRPVESAS